MLSRCRLSKRVLLEATSAEYWAGGHEEYIVGAGAPSRMCACSAGPDRVHEQELVCWHDLLHEATSRLFEKGLNIMEVASITGHQDLKMLKRYTHLRAEDLVKRLG